MSNNLELICTQEAKEAAVKCRSLRSRVRKCIEAASTHWLLTDDNARLMCAMHAAYALSTDKERARLKLEWDFLRALCDGGTLPDVTGLTGYKPIGILNMWNDAVKKRSY